MDDALIAAVVAFPLSALIVSIEITKASTASFPGIFRIPALLYFLIVLAGNIFTTFLAAAMVSQQVPAGVVPRWFWYVFFGVFGFEAVLKNVNLTFAGIGILSINDWIVKAKDAATADVIESSVMLKEQKAMVLALRLKKLSEKELNAYILNILGSGQVLLLESEASQSNADAQLIKALALAKGNYKSAFAILPHGQDVAMP
jgi:hypothetical protein